MSGAALAKKLRLKSRDRALILNSPGGYIESLDLPSDVKISEDPTGEFDFIHLFVRDSLELSKLRSSAIRALIQDGLFWISYPKGGSKVETDLNRDILWKKMEDTGLRPVTQISIDEVWSAMRFRPIDEVGK